MDQLPDTLVANEVVADLIDLLRVQKEEWIKKGLVSKVKNMLPITENEIPFKLPVTWGHYKNKVDCLRKKYVIEERYLNI